MSAAPQAAPPEEPLRRILMATDGEAASQAAERTAADLASRLGLGLTLLHVVETPIFSKVGALMERLLTDQGSWASQMLVERAAALRQDGLDIRTQVTTGDPAAQIIGEAQAPGVDMVVVGAGTDALGSVLTRLGHRCPKPLLIVRAAPG